MLFFLIFLSTSLCFYLLLQWFQSLSWIHAVRKPVSVQYQPVYIEIRNHKGKRNWINTGIALNGFTFNHSKHIPHCPQTWAGEVDETLTRPVFSLPGFNHCVSMKMHYLHTRTVVFLWQPLNNDLQYHVMCCFLWHDGINKWGVIKSFSGSEIHEFRFLFKTQNMLFFVLNPWVAYVGWQQFLFKCQYIWIECIWGQ